MEEIILLALAILPVFLLAFFIYKKDKFEKEPLKMLLKAFLFGCLSVIPAIFLETVLSSLYSNTLGYFMPGFVEGAYTGFIVAGGSEELCKLIMLILVVRKSADFNEYFDGVVYACFVSLGFAGVENVLYVFRQDTFFEAINTGTMRALLAVPGHFLFAVAMGYYFALAKFEERQRHNNYLKAFLIPMLLHGTYDTLLMIPEQYGDAQIWLSAVLFPLFIYFDIRMWKGGLRKLKKLQAMSEAQQNEQVYENVDDSQNGDVGNGDNFSGFNWNV